MHNLIVGTAGHIDHGKTELIKALTGVDTDRLKDEKERGISIDLGFARFALNDEKTVLGVVDVPGHEAFIRNMLAGVTGIDLVLFVIAADEGIMPQTREHLDILRYLDVKQGILVITKADLVEEEWLELVVDEARELMRGTFLEEAPVVVTSARTGRGMEELNQRLAEVAGKIEARPAEDLFRLPIDRVFTIRGMGTVVTGTVWSGSIEVDQVVTVHPPGKQARVKGIQVHSKDRSRAVAGMRVALALSGLSRYEIERGATALWGSEWEPTMMVDAYLDYLPTAAGPLKNRTRIRFHLATQEVMGRVVMLEGRELAGGKGGYVQLRLEKPVVARKGDRFVIRSYSPLATIGGGSVLIPYARKRNTIDRGAGEHLRILRASPPERVMVSLIREKGMRGYPAYRLPIDMGMGPKSIETIRSAMEENGEIVGIKGELFHRTALDELRRRILDGLRSYHAENPLQRGVKREELRHRIPGVFPARLLEVILNGLVVEGKVDMSEGEVGLSSHRIVFSGRLDEMADRILALLSSNPLAPPDVKRLSSELEIDAGKVAELLSALQRLGKVVKLDDMIWMTSAGLRSAREQVEEYLEKNGKATAGEIRRVLNVSRKYAIPILEYLDGAGVTYRKGDYRYPAG